MSPEKSITELMAIWTGPFNNLGVFFDFCPFFIETLPDILCVAGSVVLLLYQFLKNGSHLLCEHFMDQ